MRWVKKMQRLMRIKQAALLLKRTTTEITMVPATDDHKKIKMETLHTEHLPVGINIDMKKEQAVFDDFFGPMQPTPVAETVPAPPKLEDMFNYFDTDEYNLVHTYESDITEIMKEILPANDDNNWLAINEPPWVQPSVALTHPPASEPLLGELFFEPACPPTYFEIPEMTPERNESFAVFVKAMRISPDQIMEEREFLHCNKDNAYDDKIATRKENNSFVNNEKIVQHRPIGSITSKKYLPDELRTCPCDCAKRNPSSEIDLQGMLDAMVKREYMRNGELLQLLLPPLIKNAVVKQIPPVLGVFIIETKENSVDYWFKDMGSGDKHCCPIAWFYFTFVAMAGEGLVSDVFDMADIVKVQMNLRNNCANFVSVMDLNLNLYQLMKSYRHDIGMYRTGAGKDPSRTRIALKNADDDNIPFKTRDEVRAFFCDYALDPWPEKTLWQDAQTRRIRLYEQQLEGYISRVRCLQEEVQRLQKMVNK